MQFFRASFEIGYRCLPMSLLKILDGGMAGVCATRNVAPRRTTRDMNGPSPLVNAYSGSE